MLVFDAPRKSFTYSAEVGLQMIRDAREYLSQLEEELERSLAHV